MASLVKFTVTISGEEVQVDGTHTDAARYELEARRNGWPAQDDAPVLWSAFMAWCGLVRAGKFPGTFDQFLDAGAAFTVADDDGGAGVAEPFRAGDGEPDAGRDRGSD